MNNHLFLSYIPDPFSVYGTQYMACHSGGNAETIDAESISNSQYIVTTICSTVLIDELRRFGLPPPAKLLDLSEALKLWCALPKDEGGEKKSDLWLHLSPHFETPAESTYFKQVFKSSIARPNDDTRTKLLTSACHAITELWRSLEKMLKDSGEFERFMNVELPIHSIFSYRQFEGIEIEREIITTLLKELSKEKYTAYQDVANIIKKGPTGLTFWNIQNHLFNTDLSELSSIADGGRLRDAFKLAAHRSNFARSFLLYLDATKDETILRQAAGQDYKIYPIFRTVGTVTGRILVEDPYLQQLRKKYRSVIATTPDMCLVYFDYSQFEPGIVAFLSNDQFIIDAYNNGDIYTALSNKIFSSSDYRSISKKIYLAYCYGMSASRITNLICGPQSKDGEKLNLEKSVSDFFSSTTGFDRLRSESEAELEKTGYAKSIFGNRRQRIGTGKLTKKESRWALNQRVQATASLIFKESVIGVANAMGRESIMLPMHDAILVKIPKIKALEHIEAIKNIMKSAFESRCPGINARVTSGSFSEAA